MLQTFDDLRSMETIAATLTDEEIDVLIEDLEVALLNWSWNWTARADQLAATNDPSRVVGFIGGRGAGKTRTGGEWIRSRIGTGRKYRFALVGRTAGDVRDTMVQGESGLLNCFPPSERPKYTPTARRVDFTDGSEALCYSAEVPSQLRGPQFHYAWADELAAWDLRPDDSGLSAWDNLKFATRLGKLGEDPHPGGQILFTTTPKRIKMLRDILAEAKTSPKISIYNQASTLDNVHLARDFIDDVTGIYGGTRLADQEIYGILSDKVEGALWSEELIAEHRTYEDPGRLPIRVIGVDPTTADNPGDECGIVAIGATPRRGPVLKRTAYVLGDRSLKGPPKEWAQAVVAAAKEFDATVVAEDNQGGAMVRETIHGVDAGIHVRLVTATTSKKMRADPVSMATEQGRVKFFRRFPELEDQMTTWVPSDKSAESPDRVDALVHALTGVVTIAKRTKGSGGGVRTSNPGKGRSLGIRDRRT